MKAERTDNARIVTKLMMKLLPIQILLALVGGVNSIVSSFFASNYVGISAMSAVGLYNPINMLIGAVSTMLAGGSAILCGKYMGKNEQDRMQNVFSLNLLITVLIAGMFTVLLLILGLFDLTGFFTGDEAVRPLLNQYLIGQAAGIFPLMLGNQLPVYLSLENRQRRTMAASLIYIGANLVFNWLFVQVLRLEALGLALASSAGLWIFLGVQTQVFLGGRSHYKLQFSKLWWPESRQIVLVGLPGAASYGYQAVRIMIVNNLMQAFIGSVAISAFTASDSVLKLFWSVPTGMLAVSRLMISLSVGEEDRQTLTDVMRVMVRRYIPLMCGICAVIILCAEPFTRIFFHDPAEPVYMMTVWGFRILPLCMPLSIVCMHFTCYAQASGKQGLVNLLALLDGLVFVAGFSAILVPMLKINGVYIANVLNGIGCILVILGYSCLKRKRFPRNMEQLMVIPDDFGAEEEARIDISVRSMEGVVKVSGQVMDFCRRRGIDERRAYLSGLCLEEMAGNIVEHGFTKDRRQHSIDIRVIHKDDCVILRIRDDCVPFDPGERKELFDPEDIVKNAGIRMVYRIARDIDYQNILGLNVLTIRI